MREVSDNCAFAGRYFGMAERSAGAVAARALPTLTITMPGFIAFPGETASLILDPDFRIRSFALASRRGTEIPTVFLTPGIQLLERPERIRRAACVPGRTQIQAASVRLASKSWRSSPVPALQRPFVAFMI